MYVKLTEINVGIMSSFVGQDRWARVLIETPRTILMVEETKKDRPRFCTTIRDMGR